MRQQTAIKTSATWRDGGEARSGESMTGHRSPLLFFALTLLLAAPFWALGAVAGQSLPQGIGMKLPISSLMVVSPVAAAIILIYREERLAGVKRLLRRTFDLKSIRPRIWFAPILLLMPVITALSYGVMRLMGIPLPDLNIPWISIPILLVVYFVAAFGEEVGWMGYAIDPLQQRWTALGASIIVGSVGALWHIPAFIQVGDAPGWIVAQCVVLIATRTLMVWIYNNAGRSLLAAIIVHDLMNLSDAIAPNYASSYAPVVIGGVTVILAVIITGLWGTRTLARFRFSRPYFTRPR